MMQTLSLSRRKENRKIIREKGFLICKICAGADGRGAGRLRGMVKGTSAKFKRTEKAAQNKNLRMSQRLVSSFHCLIHRSVIWTNCWYPSHPRRMQTGNSAWQMGVRKKRSVTLSAKNMEKKNESVTRSWKRTRELLEIRMQQLLWQTAIM